MTYATVLTGPERRRRWSEEDRRRIVEAAFTPGAVVTEVARRYEISTALIYNWRKAARGAGGGVTFAPAVVVDAPERPSMATESSASSASAAIVVELAQGARVTIGAGACPALVTATLRSLRP
jgi:transposase